MLSFLLQVFTSFLLKRHRGRVEASVSSVVVSGLTQFLICLGLFIYRFLHYADGQVFGGSRAALKAAELGGETAVMGSGTFVLAAYMIQPVTILLVYLILEGLVRFLAASITGETAPNFVLAIVSMIHSRVAGTASELAMGARVADQVEALNSDDVKLRIRSCRQKPEWDQRVTIFYNDQLYEVAGNETGGAPRRFVYLLRLKPANKVVRGTYHYSPTEVLARR